MTKAKGRNRQERSLVKMSVVPTAEPWRPEPGQCRADEYVVPLLGAGDRVAVRTLTDDRGRIVDFALIQQTEIAEDEWADVIQVDCAHGEAHVHRHSSGKKKASKKLLRRIDGPDDVNTSYEEALSLIYDHWAENVERWERGR